MKLFLIVLLIACQFAFGQSKPPARGKQNSSYQLNNDTSKRMDIRERLVQLAMQNPNYEIADRTASIAAYQVRIAKSSWLALMNAQGNINEFTINPSSAGTNPNGTPIPNYYPKYNFGIGIPFDVFTRIPNNVKIARQNYYIAEAQKNERYRLIREEVLTVYEDYLLIKQTLEFQIQVTQDEYTLYKRAEKDYSDGIIKLEDFDKFYKNWTTEQIKKLTYQRNLNVIKLNLERITGTKIDDLLQQAQQ